LDRSEAEGNIADVSGFTPDSLQSKLKRGLGAVQLFLHQVLV
jgi:hypothetical protein